MQGLFSSDPQQSVLSAPHRSDRAARNYRPGPDECALYFYLEDLPWPLNPGAVQFYLDQRKLGQVDSAGYLFTTHAPGTVQIAAYQLKIATQCAAGERLYIRTVKAADTSWATGEDLSVTSDADGVEAIRQRKLVLLE
jgi:hypothetical protein